VNNDYAFTIQLIAKLNYEIQLNNQFDNF